jgi:hypothetical protein
VDQNTSYREPVKHGPDKPRYSRFPVKAVRITAADFNGKTFDGSPFASFPEWLNDALLTGDVRVGHSRETDYAIFEVRVEDDDRWVVGPGDYIVKLWNGKLSAMKANLFEIYFYAEEEAPSVKPVVIPTSVPAQS